jgi:hypothetical protein
MKRFLISLIGSFSLVQFAYTVVPAATSALTQSLLEYEAITDTLGTDPSFKEAIPATEFIIDIQRMTRDVDILGKVDYRIFTYVPNMNTESNGNQKMPKSGSDEVEKSKHALQMHVYVATIEVSPNPGIGPNIVKVLSIKRAGR